MQFFNVIMFAVMSMVYSQPKTTKVLFFGDSITEAAVHPNGYISALKDILQSHGQGEKYTLIGAGISGNKVYDLFFRLEKDVLTKKPDVVVIWIGVNDVWHKSSMGTGTDANKFELMYGEIILRLQKEGIKVFCCTPACIGEKTDHSNAQDGDLNEYSKIIRRTAQENGAHLIDIRKNFLEYNLQHNPQNKRSGILTTDGVHLNDKGNLFVADMMWKSIF